MAANHPWGEYSADRVEAALRARVVGYELYALATTVPDVRVPNDAHIARSTLDACLIHARCCIEFFLGRLRRNGDRDWNQNDISPADFLTGWVPKPAQETAYLDAQLPLIDKHLSHVTITRADLFGHRWNITALEQAIFTIADAFLQEMQHGAPDRHAELAPWFNLATTTKADMLKEGVRKGVDRTSVRSGIEVTLMVPQGIPGGAWVAWIQRYQQENNITWPS